MKFDVKRIDENTTKLTSVEYGDDYYITRKDYQFYLEKIDPPCNDATWIATLSTFELARDTEASREFEKLYEGYFFSEAKVVYNDTNGGVYIYARYYKKEAEFWHNTHRMRR